MVLHISHDREWTPVQSVRDWRVFLLNGTPVNSFSEGPRLRSNTTAHIVYLTSDMGGPQWSTVLKILSDASETINFFTHYPGPRHRVSIFGS